MAKIKLTAKRQATFPARVCEELGVAPGDELELNQTRIGRESVWVLKPSPRPRSTWIGSLRRFAANAGGDHSMESIRESIAKGRFGS